MFVVRGVMRRLFLMRRELWRLLVVQCRSLQQLCRVGRMLVVRVGCRALVRHAGHVLAGDDWRRQTQCPPRQPAPPRTYAPANRALLRRRSRRISPVGGASPAGASYRGPTSGEDSRAIEPVRIEARRRSPTVRNWPPRRSRILRTGTA